MLLFLFLFSFFTLKKEGIIYIYIYYYTYEADNAETCNRDHKCDAYRLYRRIESDFDICITCMYVKFLEHYRKEIYFVHNGLYI